MLIIESMKSKMPEYKCYDEPPKYYKDTNDNLCIRLGIKKAKVRVRINNNEQIR